MVIKGLIILLLLGLNYCEPQMDYYQSFDFKPINLTHIFKINKKNTLNCSILEIILASIKLKCKNVFKYVIYEPKNLILEIIQWIFFVIYLVIHLMVLMIKLVLDILQYVLYRSMVHRQIDQIYKPVYEQNKLIILANSVDFTTLIFLWILSILLVILYIKYEK